MKKQKSSEIDKSLTHNKFILRTKPHKLQRYDTVGDWEPGSPTVITVSEMFNTDYEFLVMVHELIECYLCEKRGISDTIVTAFDEKFERERMRGLHTVDEEPGSAPDAPYKKEHFFAEAVERIIAHELGVDWNRYEHKIMSL